jgi:hypothetical protein
MRGLKFKAKTLNALGHGKTELTEILSRGRKIREKGMNQTEKAFSLLLEEARDRGEIRKWHFEEVSLKIAPNTRYNPDFVAVLPNGAWQVFEIKGHLEDDAAVKFKAAAEKFPEIGFHMLKRIKGQWVTIYNLPSETKDLTEAGDKGKSPVWNPTLENSQAPQSQSKRGSDRLKSGGKSGKEKGVK